MFNRFRSRLLREFFRYSAIERMVLLLLSSVFLSGILYLYLKDGNESSSLLHSNDHIYLDSLSKEIDKTTSRKGYYSRSYKRKDSILKDKSKALHAPHRRRNITQEERIAKDSSLTLYQYRKYPKRDKFTRDTLIDLNLADTTLLMRVPGIGSSRSKRIISYRDRLGGYISVSQLSEIEGLPDTLHRWFTVSGTPLRYLAVNHDGVEKLRKHPYMNFYRARRIVEYRKEYGVLKSISQLSLFEEFPDSVLNKVSGYLYFE